MKKDILIEDGVSKDFCTELQKFIDRDVEDLQFIKDISYYTLTKRVYENCFLGLTDNSDISDYVKAGTKIYKYLDGLNRRLQVACGGNLDEYLLWCIAGQIIRYFDGSQTLSYENNQSLGSKIKQELKKASHGPYPSTSSPHIRLNDFIEQKRISNYQLVKKTGISYELISALRSGKKRCTKDICYMLALKMNLTKREFKNFIEILDMENAFHEERDDFIQSYMDNLILLQNMPEHKGKSSIEIINILLKNTNRKQISTTISMKPKEDKVRTIFITGALGFIGQNCIDYFLSQSHKPKAPFVYKICVLSTTSVRNDSIPQGVTYYHGELNDPLIYERILLENSVDYIIHLSAIPIVGDARKNLGNTIDINAQALSILCNAILQNHLPVKGIIFPSTEHVYSEGLDVYKEDTPINDSHINSTYAYSKFIAESIAHSYAKEGIPIVIARLCNIYGEHDNHITKRLIPKTIDMLAHNEPPVLLVDTETNRSATVDLLYVGDLVRAFHLLLQAFDDPTFSDNKIITYNIGSGKGVEVEHIQKTIMKLMGKDFTIKRDYVKIANRGIMDIEKFRQKYGFSPEVDLEEGLCRTINWYMKSHLNKQPSKKK